MKEIHGKQVFDSLAEVVDPEHTAVLVVDMQNDLAHPDGLGPRTGSDISGQRDIIPPLQRLLDSARSAGAKVVYIEVVTEPNYATMAPAWLYRYRVNQVKTPLDQRLLEGTWGAETVEEIAPQPGDVVVKKHRVSAWIHTSLDQVLRSNGVKSVVVTGTATSGCVLGTALDAQWYDYYTVVARDCIAGGAAARNAVGIALMNEGCDMPTSGELIALWGEK